MHVLLIALLLICRSERYLSSVLYQQIREECEKMSWQSAPAAPVLTAPVVPAPMPVVVDASSVATPVEDAPVVASTSPPADGSFSGNIAVA
jgi:hypothetical protein